MTTTEPTPTRRRVDGWLVFALALLLSLLISWGPLTAAMHGETDILAAGTRYLVGLALSWAGLFGFAMLLTTYSATIPGDEDEDDVAERFDGPEVPERRATDAPRDFAVSDPSSEAPEPAADAMAGRETPPRRVIR